jgi:hypothetical protein
MVAALVAATSIIFALSLSVRGGGTSPTTTPAKVGDGLQQVP